MRSLIYDVAVTLDGRISDAQGGVAGFLQSGDHVDAYRARLEQYDTAIMGRRTYEFGYRWGMRPGDKPYPHMEHYVFSSTLQLPAASQVKVVRTDAVAFVSNLKAAPGGDIYLCGGGALAGALLSARLIDRIVAKLNPAVAGAGVSLVADSVGAELALVDARTYASGVVQLTYDVASSAH